MPIVQDNKRQTNLITAPCKPVPHLFWSLTGNPQNKISKKCNSAFARSQLWLFTMVQRQLNGDATTNCFADLLSCLEKKQINQWTKDTNRQISLHCYCTGISWNHFRLYKISIWTPGLTVLGTCYHVSIIKLIPCYFYQIKASWTSFRVTLTMLMNSGGQHCNLNSPCVHQSVSYTCQRWQPVRFLSTKVLHIWPCHQLKIQVLWPF